MSRANLEGWRSIHERDQDGTIDSDERVSASRAVVPATQGGARLLGERYWRIVQRSSLASRGCATRDGSVAHLAGAPLLRFAPAKRAADTNGAQSPGEGLLGCFVERRQLER